MLHLVSSSEGRKSGVELFKIIAIFLIVINHVTQTLCSENILFPDNNYVVSIGISTSDIQVILLTLLRQTGALGNNIFLVCSAWFLVGKVDSASKKAFKLVCTVWSISIIFLFIYLTMNTKKIIISDIIRQLLPNCFENNWYTTCYIIFLFIYPFVNRLISHINQKEHFRIVVFTSTLWIVINYLNGIWFFPSLLILWISVFFMVAYLKMYCPQTMNNIRVGKWLLTIGIVGYFAQVIVSNYVGLYFISWFSDKLLRWNTNCCPFYLLIAIGGLIISLQADFVSKVINYISGLSLYIYLIHENYLFRNYTRPVIWQKIYENIGYSQVVLLDLLFSLVLFIVSIVLSLIYKETIQKIVVRISNRIYELFIRIGRELEGIALRIR